MASSSLVALSQTRARVIALLSEHYSHDLLDVDEFERRLTVAHTATEVAALDALVADLPAPVVSTALVPVAAAAPVTIDQVGRPRQRYQIVSVLGTGGRTGSWTVPRLLSAVTVLGTLRIDLRGAQLSGPEVEIDVRCVLGTVEIIIPPGLSVSAEGISVLSTFEHVEPAPGLPEPTVGAPLVRIRGVSVLGTVTVMTWLPGETHRDARRRERAATRALRKALRQQHRLTGR